MGGLRGTIFVKNLQSFQFRGKILINLEDGGVGFMEIWGSEHMHMGNHHMGTMGNHISHKACRMLP